MEEVCIIMATYNGEKYIKKQIDSIISQTYLYWKLYIKDDGSNDSTCEIINEYSKKFPDNIFLIKEESCFKSAKKNFFFLLNYVKRLNFKYIFLCDQDDVWNNNKLEIMVDRANLEDDNIPLLIHTDASLIDENDNIYEKSWNKISKMNKKRNDIISVCLWNVSQGCTMLLNSKCLEYIDCNVENIVMHDWWLTMVAVRFGKIIYLDEPLILYRQHESNVVGGNKQKKIIDILGIKRMMKYAKNTHKNYKKAYVQAGEFFKKYDNFNEKKKYFINNNIINRIKIVCLYRLIRIKGIKTCMGYILYG